MQSLRFDLSCISSFQRDIAGQIVEIVSRFANQTLLQPSPVNADTVQRFISDVKPQLANAATFAVEDYFERYESCKSLSIFGWNGCCNTCSLDGILRDCNGPCCIETKNKSGRSIVLAEQGFSYPGSFLDLVNKYPCTRATNVAITKSLDGYSRSL